MKICVVYEGNFPHVRLSKEIDSLLENGHDIIIICLGRKNQDSYEKIGNLEIHRLKLSSIVKKSFDVITAAFFIHPLFYSKLNKIAKDNNIDVIHFVDLPIARTCNKIAKKYNCKLVYDMFENYPAGIKIWYEWNKNTLIRLKNKILYSQTKWRKYEGEALRFSDKIIAVVDEMKSRVIEEYNIPETKIDIVTNSESKDFITDCDYEYDFGLNFEENFIITYIGGIGPHRGVDTLISSVLHTKKTIPNIKVAIAGSGNKFAMDYLRSIIKEHDLEKHIVFLNQIPFNTVFSLMSKSHINVIPHLKGEHTDNTVPHKLFQIMMSDRPLLSSNCNPLARIVGSDYGYVFESGNPEDLARQVKEIETNYNVALEKASKAKEVTMEGDLNWEHTQNILVNCYKQLESN